MHERTHTHRHTQAHSRMHAHTHTYAYIQRDETEEPADSTAALNTADRPISELPEAWLLDPWPAFVLACHGSDTITVPIKSRINATI